MGLVFLLLVASLVSASEVIQHDSRVTTNKCPFFQNSASFEALCKITDNRISEHCLESIHDITDVCGADEDQDVTDMVDAMGPGMEKLFGLNLILRSTLDSMLHNMTLTSTSNSSSNATALLSPALGIDNNTTANTTNPEDWVVVCFFQPSCPFSRQLLPRLRLASLLFPSLSFVLVNATYDSNIVFSYEVFGVPALFLFHNGQQRARFLQPPHNFAALADFISRNTHLNVSASSVAKAQTALDQWLSLAHHTSSLDVPLTEDSYALFSIGFVLLHLVLMLVPRIGRFLSSLHDAGRVSLSLSRANLVPLLSVSGVLLAGLYARCFVRSP